MADRPPDKEMPAQEAVVSSGYLTRGSIAFFGSFGTAMARSEKATGRGLPTACGIGILEAGWVVSMTPTSLPVLPHEEWRTPRPRRLRPEGAATYQPRAERSGAAAERRPGLPVQQKATALKGRHRRLAEIRHVPFLISRPMIRDIRWLVVLRSCPTSLVPIRQVGDLFRPFRAWLLLVCLPRAALRSALG